MKDVKPIRKNDLYPIIKHCRVSSRSLKGPAETKLTECLSYEADYLGKGYQEFFHSIDPYFSPTLEKRDTILPGMQPAARKDRRIPVRMKQREDQER